MASLFGKFLRWIFVPKDKTVKHISIDPESVKEHNMIRALANENAELKGRLAKYIADEGETRLREEDIAEEEDVKLELNKQKKELQKKVYPKYFSLKSFFWKLKNKQFKEKLGFYDFKREKRLAKFGDIGFSSDGDIVLLNDKNQVLLKMKDLHDIFQSVGGLGNDVDTFKIPINLDKDLVHVENFELWKAPQIIPKNDGTFEYTKAKKEPFYKYLSELNDTISDLSFELEEKEKTIAGIEVEKGRLERDLSSLQKKVQVLEKDISKQEIETQAKDDKFRDIEKQVANLTNIKIVTEEELDLIKEKLERLQDKAMKEGITLQFDDVVKRIERIQGLFEERTVNRPFISTANFPEPTGEVEVKRKNK